LAQVALVFVFSLLCPRSKCDAMSCRTCLVLLTLAITSAEDTAAGNLRGASKEDVRDALGVTELPDAKGLPDIPGPYKEVPSDAGAEKPTPAMMEWRSKVPNATQGSLGSLVSSKAWQDYQFCNVHQTGFFCDGTTRIRCCKLEDGAAGYAKCGSTAKSSTCTDEPEPSKQKSLGLASTGQSGWRSSSFCQSHHVGLYCYLHRYIQCCNAGGWIVECNPEIDSVINPGGWCLDVFI